MNYKILFLVYFLAIIFFIQNFLKQNQINWSDKVSAQTISDSWGTFKNNFQDLSPLTTREKFFEAIKNGQYKTLSIGGFLKLNVENQRLEKYLYAKTAEDAYPLTDRPRNDDDIKSVNYFLTTKNLVSPIVVAKIKFNNDIRYIKLDGAHRLVAAAIKKSPIKILFIDL